MLQQIEEIQVSDSYGRFKGMSWFPNIYKKEIIVIGQGGIGSWVSLLLARAGASLHTFDMDSFEKHNMSGQLVRNSDIGKNKAEAINGVIKSFCDESTEVTTYNEKYTKNSITGNIVIMGVDNMETRKVGFENWVNYLEENPEEKENSLFIDGRLSATVLQIFCIKGSDLSSVYKYKEQYLFDDSEVEDLECTTKQTSHLAAMIAGHMVGYLTNFLATENFPVPFFYEFIQPANFTTNE